MLYRLAMIGIVAFWMVMMGMLVRLETHPETTDILEVPVSYVTRIMFKHGEHSLLTVREEGKSVGAVSLRPSITGPDGRSLDFSGAVSIELPLGGRQRFNFNGNMDMDRELRVLDFHVDLAVPDQHFHLNAQGDTARKILTYQVSQGGRQSAPQTLPLDAAAFGPALLQALGQEANAPLALPISPGAIAPPTVTARETQITLHGEQLQVYQVTIREGTALAADFYVTQLGQVVLAKTNFGYSLSAEDYQ